MNQFKIWRESAGLSQGDVSKKLGFSTHQYISNVERSVSTMTFKHVKALSKMFKVDPKLIADEIQVFRTNEFLSRMERERKQSGL